MREILKPVIIFSVFDHTKDSFDNLDNHNKIKDRLKARHIKFVETIGQYKGTKELSLVVDAVNVSGVKNLMKLYNQESYLYLDQDRNATLVYNDRQESLGVFREVPESYEGDYTQNALGGPKFAVIDNSVTIEYDVFKQLDFIK
jgi:hypothetical protein